MNQPETYGSWERSETGLEKKEDGVHIELSWESDDNEITCLIEDTGVLLVFRNDNPSDLEDIIENIMKRTSDGESITDVLEDEEFSMGHNYV